MQNSFEYLGKETILAFLRKSRLDSNLNLKSFDPGLLLKALEYHKLSSIFWDRVRFSHRQEELHPDAAAKLENICLKTAASNTVLYEQLKKFLNLADNLGVETIVLKGSLTAEFLYKNISLRPNNDIDVLVNRDKLDLLDANLPAIGYSGKSTNSLSLHREKHPVYQHLKLGPLLEIHYIPGKNFIHAVDDFRFILDSSIIVPLGGFQARILSPENMLIYECFHLSKHETNRLFKDKSGFLLKILDLLLLIKLYAEKINWDYIAKYSHEWNIRSSVYFYLKMLRDVFGADTPENLLDKNNPVPSPAEIFSEACRMAWDDEYKRRAALKNYIVGENMQESRWNIVKKALFPPISTLRNNFGLFQKSFLDFRFYFVLWFRKFARYALPSLKMFLNIGKFNK